MFFHNYMICAFLCVWILSTNAQTTTKPKKESIEKQLFKVTKISDLKIPGIKVNILTKQAVRTNTTTQQATVGKCDPKLVCIPNPLALSITTNNQIAHPKCINIYRCGGCCANNEVCMPTKTQTVAFTNVGIVNIDKNNEIFYEETVVNVKNETQCECQCPLQSDKDCKSLNQNFILDSFNCECVCPEKLYCSPYHQFDENLCKCICNKEKYGKIESACLSKGMKWNEIDCKCEGTTIIG